MAGPISSMEPTKAFHIHIASKVGQLRISCHEQTVLLTAFDCPVKAQQTTTSIARASPQCCSVSLHSTARGENTVQSVSSETNFESVAPCFSPMGVRSTSMACC